jgi:hypothetical protein
MRLDTGRRLNPGLTLFFSHRIPYPLFPYKNSCDYSIKVTQESNPTQQGRNISRNPKQALLSEPLSPQSKANHSV